MNLTRGSKGAGGNPELVRYAKAGESKGRWSTAKHALRAPKHEEQSCCRPEAHVVKVLAPTRR